MPTRGIPMQKIQDILRLKYESKLSHEKIARALALSKGVVAKYISAAQAHGISWPLSQEHEATLERLLSTPARTSLGAKAKPDCFYLHTELKHKGVTLRLLWEEYAAVHGPAAYRYSRFCEHYQQWRARQKRSMRQRHIAGEKLFIDYCGPTVDVVDGATGEIRQAQVFVAVLGASNYTYVEATWTQGLPDWIASHVRALAFFGGVVRLLVPDNLKSGVLKADRYAPQINSTYAELARHYGTAILPTRPYKPKDKAKAEVAVQVAERWILARLRHQTFFSLGELNVAIRQLVGQMNERPLQRQKVSRRMLFETLDLPVLHPLPSTPYEYAQWKKAKVGIDYHIEFDGRLFSIPHSLVGEVVELRITAMQVGVLHKGKQVAIHQRHGQGRFSTQPHHMPESHRRHQEWSPRRFLSWAKQIGSATHTVVRYQLENRPHPEHGYRACLGILHQGRHYGNERLEQACAQAVKIGSPTYRSVASILKNGLDKNLFQEPVADHKPVTHNNLRGPNYYH
uniref:Transposase n=1 Tax=Candidatus Kentrum sp. DK TaxID=2126562 RepID=A0A450S0M5_9GAMM|nr:MAG: Transposase [Candidatus Kentron sp. DK]VFJ55962.1 MAG: Transposase [Candidatus Kentron sp. DK]